MSDDILDADAAFNSASVRGRLWDGNILQKFSLRRKLLAELIGVDAIRLRPTKSVWLDAIKIVWLRSLTDSEVEAWREKGGEGAEEEALLWAEANDIEPGAPRGIQAVAIYAKTFAELNAATPQYSKSGEVGVKKNTRRRGKRL